MKGNAQQYINKSMNKKNTLKNKKNKKNKVKS